MITDYYGEIVNKIHTTWDSSSLTIYLQQSVLLYFFQGNVRKRNPKIDIPNTVPKVDTCIFKIYVVYKCYITRTKGVSFRNRFWGVSFRVFNFTFLLLKSVLKTKNRSQGTYFGFKKNKPIIDTLLNNKI